MTTMQTILSIISPGIVKKIAMLGKPTSIHIGDDCIDVHIDEHDKLPIPIKNKRKGKLIAIQYYYMGSDNQCIALNKKKV